MRELKELVLRKFGDQGAETLANYFAQIEYTAYWCIAILDPQYSLVGVIPEGVEDVVLEFHEHNKLYQVKTKGEGQGAWLSLDVLRILCNQYRREEGFDKECHFHFVSNQMADTNESKRQPMGSLFEMKRLLGLLHEFGLESIEDQQAFKEYEKKWTHGIVNFFKSEFQKDISIDDAKSFLKRTWIETDSAELRNPNNLTYLQQIVSLHHGIGIHPIGYYEAMYMRLLFLIIQKIIKGNSLDSRRICKSDVLGCIANTQLNSFQNVDLSALPGKTLLEKKALLGGFDVTELPAINRTSLSAKLIVRELKIQHTKNKIDSLISDLLDLHQKLRHKVCRENNIINKPGPNILALLRAELPLLISKYKGAIGIIDETLCVGILWDETNKCNAYWHALE